MGFGRRSSNPSLNLARRGGGGEGGFGVTFWELWRFLSDFDYESSSGGLVFSPEVKLRHNVAVILYMKEISVACSHSWESPPLFVYKNLCSNWMNIGGGGIIFTSGDEILPTNE